MFSENKNQEIHTVQTFIFGLQDSPCILTSLMEHPQISQQLTFYKETIQMSLGTVFCLLYHTQRNF